jgi:hypothetical protein
MSTLDDDGRMEYTALMNRGRDAERTGQICWTAGSLCGAVMLSWAMSAKSPALMLPVELAIAIGFYAMLRSRQQVRWIASYVEEFCENRNGLQWFTRVHKLQNLPGYSPVGDWLTVCLANAGIVIATIMAWMYSSAAARGELMASITTACGVLFAFHSVSETIRLSRTDSTGMWRQVGGELREVTSATRSVLR